MAFCTRCKKDLPDKSFSPSQADRGRAWCKRCLNAVRKARREGTSTRLTDTCLQCSKALTSKRSHAKWCSAACAAKGYHAANPGAARDRRLKSTYGILPDEVRALLAKQRNACAICRVVPDRPLHVDHDHATGKIRGLLCQRCNQGIGQLDDSPARLRQAIAYLKRK